MRPHRFARAFLHYALRRRSFTLPELLSVILITGILAAAGLPVITGAFADMSLRSAAQTMVANLNYIRNLAITEGAEYGFEFTATTYSAFKRTSDGLDRESVLHPLTHRTWAVDLSAAKIKLSADFSGGGELYYDMTGAPNPPGTVLMATDDLVITVTVEASTGRVERNAMIAQMATCKVQNRARRISRTRVQRRRPTFFTFRLSFSTSSQGFSLAELLVVISISSALFLSLTAALSGTLSTTAEVAGQLSSWHIVSSALLQMERELALATQIEFPGNERISFYVPDITGDSTEDLVQYSWDGTDGAPLVRTVNGASPTNLMPEVREVRFSYNYRNRESHGIVTATKDLNVVAASFDKYAAHGYQSVFRPIESGDWQAQSFVPAADTHQTDSVEFNLRLGAAGAFGVGHLSVMLAEVETGQSIATGSLQAPDIQQADDMQTFTVPMISMMGESSGTSTEKEYELELKPMGFSYAGEVELLTVTDPEGPDNYMRYEWSIDGGMSFMNIGNMGDIPFVTRGTYVVQYGLNAEHTVWRLGRVSIYLKYGSGKNEVAINSAVRMHNAK